MKFQVVLLGVLFCLAAQAASRPSHSAPTAKKADRAAQQTLIGCIDEHDGHCVLLDDHMVKITNLQPAGTDREIFAKYLGH